MTSPERQGAPRRAAPPGPRGRGAALPECLARAHSDPEAVAGGRGPASLEGIWAAEPSRPPGAAPPSSAESFRAGRLREPEEETSLRPAEGAPRPASAAPVSLGREPRAPRPAPCGCEEEPARSMRAAEEEEEAPRRRAACVPPAARGARARGRAATAR